MDSILHQVFQWVLVSSVKGGILVAVILATKSLVRNRLDANWHYAIWALLFLQLVLPWTPSSPLSIYKLFPTTFVEAAIHSDLRPSSGTKLSNPVIPSKPSTSDTASELISSKVSSKVSNPLPEVSEPGLPHTTPLVYPLWELAAWFWLAGITFFVIRIGITEYLFRKKLKKAKLVFAPHLPAILEDCKQLAGVSKNIILMETDALKGPALFGLFRIRMLLPTGLAGNLTSQQLAHIFLHELVHYKRHDIAVNWIAGALRTVHWFNPLIWYGFNRWQDDQELSCDALAVRYLKPEVVHDYGRTLIRVLEFAGPQPAQLLSTVGVSGGESLSKRRIMMIKLFRKPSFKWTLVGIAAIIAVAFVAMTLPKVNDPAAKPGFSSSKTQGSSTVPADHKETGGDIQAPVPQKPVAQKPADQRLNTRPLQSEEINVPGQTAESAAAALRDYFPLRKGSKWVYQGTGNEYASFTREVVFTEGNLAQTLEMNGGANVTKIVQVTGSTATEIFKREEPSDPVNLLHEESNEQRILLKSPLSIGTKWNDGNTQIEIVDTSATVKTPAGTFKNCIKVKSTFSGDSSIMYQYYAKGVGMVQQDFIFEGEKISSSLESYHLAK